ncbi:MAG TPA: hypothetical protein VFM55_12185 [Micromonosporaceae bacterium]|nr:hypothetical protein [Micromonosporaceae bacterium]
MGDEYRWSDNPAAVLRDGLTTKDVIDALYAPESLRLDNRTPKQAPTFLVSCGPTGELRLIVVVCTRPGPGGPWTIAGARDARPDERVMWRKHTS